MDDDGIARLDFARSALLDHLTEMGEERKAQWSRKIWDAVAELDRLARYHAISKSRSRK